MIPIKVLFLALGLSAGLLADHRVALVIGNDAAVPRLEASGYRCQRSENLGSKEFFRLVESWTATTPTRGTALLYFKGQLATKDDELQLVTGNQRAVSVIKIIELMTQRGGSTDNRLIVETDEELPLSATLPEGASFGYADQTSVAPATPPSKAIAPPDRFGPGMKVGDEWVNARGMVFCWCPSGTYLAGSPEGTPGRHPDEEQRQVTIREGFWIGKYEITKSQNLRKRGRLKANEDKNEPLVDMHWDDGRRMIYKTLTAEEREAGRLPEDWEYDLPSEEQWEYAARAGTQTQFYFGHDLKELPDHGNFADKSFYESGDIFSHHAHRTLDDGFVRLAPVGRFQSNPWGLHDVYGNVWEWCRDHAARGGSWVTLPENCRSAYRDFYSSRDNQIYLGYRIVIQPCHRNEGKTDRATPTKK